MSLKQESGSQDLFINLLFNKYVDQSPASPNGEESGRNRWFLEDRIPKLGEARGKIIMLSRFVIDKSFGFPGGISPPIWPNNYKAP
jgi:1-phosphatidylinositol phosphodiesterase